jgi:hypothetical protein
MNLTVSIVDVAAPAAIVPRKSNQKCVSLEIVEGKTQLAVTRSGETVRIPLMQATLAIELQTSAIRKSAAVLEYVFANLHQRILAALPVDLQAEAQQAEVHVLLAEKSLAADFHNRILFGLYLVFS